jgi:opacity protein-like surface antigen
MSRFSRWASVAGLVCAFISTMHLAAHAQSWQTNQRFSWATTIDTSPAWTGFYGGVQIGGSFSNVRANEYLAGTDIISNSLLDAGQNVYGGIHFGYDWQVRPNWVIGVFSNINGMNDRVRHDFAGGFYIGATMDWRGSAQARVGYVAFPNTLFYVHGGLAFGGDNLEIDFGGPETNEHRLTTGWTIGGGVEVKLPQNVIPIGKATSVFLDFSHIRFDTEKLVMPVASPRFDYDWRRETNTIEGGLRFRF